MFSDMRKKNFRIVSKHAECLTYSNSLLVVLIVMALVVKCEVCIYIMKLSFNLGLPLKSVGTYYQNLNTWVNFDHGKGHFLNCSSSSSG